MIDPLLGACVEACSSWILLYARLAYAITDVPDEISVHFPLTIIPLRVLESFFLDDDAG